MLETGLLSKKTRLNDLQSSGTEHLAQTMDVGKKDGSPSVFNLFRRVWMILNAQMLLYTRVVVNIAFQQSLCAKNYLNMNFHFGIFWW